MIPSDSASKRLHDRCQVRPASRSQSQATSSPFPVPRHFEEISPFVVPQASADSVHQPSDCNQWSNFAGFLQHINFSIPPPVLPSALPAFSTCPIPSYAGDFSAPLPGISTNCYDPSENERYHEKESVLADTTVLGCKRTDERPQIQLHSFSEQLKTYYICLVKLKNDLENLNSVSSQLDSASWSCRIADLSSQRDILEKLKRTINIDSTSLALLKYKIKKRLKKRQTRKKRNLKETKSVSKYEIASLHMQQLQQIVDQQKQEERFKKEADFTLFSVRQKKSEANSQIQFLTALSKMHTARINATNAQNKPSLNDAVCGFNKIIDKLKSMWQRQIEEYLVEENGLKIMLKDLVVTAEDLHRLKVTETCGQWLKLLFGTTDLQKGSYFSNYHELIGIRREWDQYVVDEKTNSSKIPAGWVVPKHPRGDAWSKFLT